MDRDQPRTTFVIATRNRAAELRSTLGRLLDTTSCPIIVVDNGSGDDTVDMVHGIAQSESSRVKLIALRRNLGAAARNIGVAACITPYVAFCDDDSWWEASAPEIAADLFDSHPTLALLAGQTTVWPSGRRDSFSDELAASPLGHKSGTPGPSILGFQCCSAMVRASAFTGAGGFSRLLHIYGEETLLALDLAAGGWEICYCPELKAFHHPSKVRGTSSARDARVLRNEFLTACMRRPVDHCYAALRPLIRSAATDSAHAKAVAEGLIRLPAALARRRRLPEDVERRIRLLESHG
jgi:GT2 family glycosyltransferase